uniref:Lipocalin n=1 Tax=Amblyomma maculatum TaxID=34609 RepID=G3MR27_AMBMU
MKVVILQDQAITRGDLISFIEPNERIWTYRGSNQLDKGIKCKADYNFIRINDTIYTFTRDYEENQVKKSSEMQARLIISKSNKNVPDGICSSWVLTLTEDEFFCEMRVKDSITSTTAATPPKGQDFVVQNKQPPSDCLNAYTTLCTNRGKSGDTQVYYPSCKPPPEAAPVANEQ